MLEKLLKRLIKTRGMTLLVNFQFNFWEWKSSVDALNYLKSKITLSLSLKKYCGIVLFDIKSAFDSMDWHIISEIVNNSLLQLYLKCLLKKYISNRFIGVNLFEFVSSIHRGRVSVPFSGYWLRITSLNNIIAYNPKYYFTLMILLL